MRKDWDLFMREKGEQNCSVPYSLIETEGCRMNVSITRAKELLIVIGNSELMGRDPYWIHFLQFALRNKLYVEFQTRYIFY